MNCVEELESALRTVLTALIDAKGPTDVAAKNDSVIRGEKEESVRLEAIMMSLDFDGNSCQAVLQKLGFLPDGDTARLLARKRNGDDGLDDGKIAKSIRTEFGQLALHVASGVAEETQVLSTIQSTGKTPDHAGINDEKTTEKKGKSKRLPFGTAPKGSPLTT
jgi:hypothetical protein